MVLSDPLAIPGKVLKDRFREFNIDSKVISLDISIFMLLEYIVEKLSAENQHFDFNAYILKLMFLFFIKGIQDYWTFVDESITTTGTTSTFSKIFRDRIDS